MAFNADTTLYTYGEQQINKVDAKCVLSNTILENVYLKLIESDGEGITQRFSRDVTGANIRIPHFKPLGIKARLLGGKVNGGNFPTGASETESESFYVPILFLIDDPIDIAEVSEDIATVSLLAEAVKNWSNESAVEINAMTIAGKIFASYGGSAKASEVAVSTDADWADALPSANSLLDEGAVDMGIYSFPQDDRVAVIKSKYRPALLKNGVISLGGANAGYAIREKGTLSAGATPRKMEDGYIGEIDGVAVHQCPSSIFARACDWLGLAKGDLDNILGYVSSGCANVRGIASPYDVRISDHPTGRGWRLKPLLRAGFKVIEGYENGNVFLVADEDVNPFSYVKSASIKPEFVPVGSRVKLSVALTSSAATKVTATVSGGTAKKLVAVVGDVNTTAGFANGTTLTSGTEATISVATAGKVVSVLALSEDGTATIEKITIA